MRTKSFLTVILLMFFVQAFSQSSTQIDEALNQTIDALNYISGENPQQNYQKIISKSKEIYKDKLIVFSDFQTYKTGGEFVFSYNATNNAIFLFYFNENKKLSRKIILLDEKCASCKTALPKAITYKKWLDDLDLLDAISLPTLLNTYVRGTLISNTEYINWIKSNK